MQKEVFANTESVDKILRLQLTDLEFTYQHQLLMRLIDYVMNFIVFLILNPESTIMNDAYDLQSNRLPQQVYDTMLQVIFKFFCPTFLCAEISIDNTDIVLVPWV